jgi:hypothetical protein
MEKNSGIKQYDKLISHEICMTKWEEFRMSEKTDKSILPFINKENETLIKSNSLLYSTIVEILIFTSRQ